MVTFVINFGRRALAATANVPDVFDNAPLAINKPPENLLHAGDHRRCRSDDDRSPNPTRDEDLW